MKLLSYFLIVFSFNACAQKQETIRQFYPYYLVHDSVRIYDEKELVKEEYFIIANYKGNKVTDKLVDSFILSNKVKNFARYNAYFMSFYKESSHTNEANFEVNPKDIDRYSIQNDLVFIYRWEKGKFIERLKFKNGEVIEPKNYGKGITVTNANDSAR